MLYKEKMLILGITYKDVEKFRRSSPKEWKLWLTAMEDEFKSLQDRKIWELVELPKGRA